MGHPLFFEPISSFVPGAPPEIHPDATFPEGVTDGVPIQGVVRAMDALFLEGRCPGNGQLILPHDPEQSAYALSLPMSRADGRARKMPQYGPEKSPGMGGGSQVAHVDAEYLVKIVQSFLAPPMHSHTRFYRLAYLIPHLGVE